MKLCEISVPTDKTTERWIPEDELRELVTKYKFTVTYRVNGPKWVTMLTDVPATLTIVQAKQVVARAFGLKGDYFTADGMQAGIARMVCTTLNDIQTWSHLWYTFRHEVNPHDIKRENDQIYFLIHTMSLSEWIEHMNEWVKSEIAGDDDFTEDDQ